MSYKKLIVAFIICVSLNACTHLFFQPIKHHALLLEDYNIEFEDIYFKGKSPFNLHGWWFPSNGLAKANVMFLHGNGENISTHAGLVYWLVQYNYNVFIFDYRGYGKSEGEAQLEGVINDIQSARNYLANREESKLKTFLIGHSLGASLGVSTLANNTTGIDGAIFVSPFSSYPKVAREMLSNFWLTWIFQWPASLTISSKYNPEDSIGLIEKTPKVFIYSEQDSVIPAEHVLKLFSLAKQPKALVKVVGEHNSIFAQEETRRVIVGYLDGWVR